MPKNPYPQDEAIQEPSFAKFTKEINALIDDIQQTTIALSSLGDVMVAEPQKFVSCGSRLEMELNEIVLRLTNLKNSITV